MMECDCYSFIGVVGIIADEEKDNKNNRGFSPAESTTFSSEEVFQNEELCCV